MSIGNKFRGPQHVWYDVETKSWGFWDETGAPVDGYLSEKEALDARDEYARELYKNAPPHSFVPADQIPKGGAQ